ncbi:MAG: tripartite tricarboxylate transporter TctB family protein [Dethiobacteria bacterium]
MRKAEITSAVLIWGIVILFFYMTLDFPGPTATDVGGAFYPRILLATLAILSIFLLYGAVFKPKVDEKFAVNKEGLLKRVLPVIIVSIIYQQVVSLIGFLYLTPFYFLALMYIIGLKKIRSMVIASLVVTLTVWFVFRQFLQVPLPMGILFK